MTTVALRCRGAGLLAPLGGGQAEDPTATIREHNGGPYGATDDAQQVRKEHRASHLFAAVLPQEFPQEFLRIMHGSNVHLLGRWGCIRRSFSI